MKCRCGWSDSDPISTEYHDKEWGIPLHDDRRLFEMLVLEGAQAGLSWITVLRKRANYRKAFDSFQAEKIAKYDKRRIKCLLSNEGIVRNKLKVVAAVLNAKAFLRVRKEFGTFNTFIWGFVGGVPIQNSWKSLKQVPVKTKESVAMSVELRRHGFHFVGPTICYAFMQATGMVNDHIVGCFRHDELVKFSRKKKRTAR